MEAIDSIASILGNNGLIVDAAYCGIARCGMVYCDRLEDDVLAVYKRDIPQAPGDAIVIMGGKDGTSERGNIGIDNTNVLVISRSEDMVRSRNNLERVRRVLIRGTPMSFPDGTYVYSAIPGESYVYTSGPVYATVYFNEMTFSVKHKSESYVEKTENVTGTDYTSIIANYIESYIGQECHRDTMPSIQGLRYMVIQDEVFESDERKGPLCPIDSVRFCITVVSEDILEAENAAVVLHKKIHQTRHAGAIVSIISAPPSYVPDSSGTIYTYNIWIETKMERI